MQKSSYVSCIQIGGLPIIPPLMTTEIRQEMIKYRELAIKIEEEMSKKMSLLSQSKKIDHRSDPVTCINLNRSNAKQTNEVSSSMHSQIGQSNSPKIVEIDNSDSEMENDNDKSIKRSVRRNSYTLEVPSPQLIALLRANQIKDISCNQNSNSDSFTEVSKLSAKKQSSVFENCCNDNDVSCPNHKESSELNTGGVSTGSDYDSLSSDVDSMVNLTQSIDVCLREESSSTCIELGKLESHSQDSCHSEATQNQFTHDMSLKSFDSENNLDISTIKDLKLSSNDDNWKDPQNSWSLMKSKKVNMNSELRKAFLSKISVNNQEGGSLSLPTSLCSSPEPKHLFISTEDITREPSISRIPLSTKIPSRYHKLSEKSQCSFKNRTIRNHLNEAKKVGRIKHERLYSSLIEDKLNISDDSKSILNQSKLPVYMPLRHSSLGFIPFKPDTFLKKNKPSSFCKRPHVNVKETELQTNINECKNSRNKLQTERHPESVSHNSSLLSKEMVIDENESMHSEPSFSESFQKSLCVSEEGIILSPIKPKSPTSTKERHSNKSRSRSTFSNMPLSLNNKSLKENSNEDVFLHLSPSPTNSDVESLNDESSMTKMVSAANGQSPEGNKNKQNYGFTTPTSISVMTNNNSYLSPGGMGVSNRSRKQLDCNRKSTKSSTNNNSLNTSFCDTISLSGSETNDALSLSSKDEGVHTDSATEISEKSLSLLLQQLQNKHQQQMEILKQKQIEEQNLLEQQQKKITETILLNLSNSHSPTPTSPKSVRNEKSPKNTLNYDEIPVNGGLTPVLSSDTSSMTLFSLTPGFKQTNSVSPLSRYSLPSNTSKTMPNKIWFMNNIPAAKFYPKNNYNELEIKAATIIQAGIRGYFVRRLMKTERAQLLIEMIQKSIKCAFEIQQEPSPSLADYEFHSRLVQQITKACYEIHEIFIVYPEKERFCIIAADRLKRLQKINIGTSIVKPLSVATRRSLQRKSSQSSNENSAQVLRKPYRSRSHTFTSSCLHEAYPRNKSYKRSATTYNMKRPQRLSYDSRISDGVKHKAPWR